MCLKNFLSILCFGLVVGFCVGDDQQCRVLGGFAPNSTYATNRQFILSNLASNVSSGKGFYSGSIGEGVDKIYALGMCIPGTEPNLCSNCIKLASDGLLVNCPNQLDSFVWRTTDTLCFVRYSDSSFFNTLEQEPVLKLCNSESITNETEFNIFWQNFMKDMIVAASSKHYAGNVSDPIGFQRIYALMQCTPGISSNDCESCLGRSVSLYEEGCQGRQGANIRRPSCFFEWETYSIYGLNPAPDKPTPAKPPTPATPPTPLTPPSGKISRRTLIVIIVVAAIVVAMLALGFVFWRQKKSDKTSKLNSDDDIISSQSLQFDFRTLETATDKFSGKNKIGQGGFGEVYKGTLANGSEIAVKRLSKTSGQGLKEFKNEVVVVAKLRHRNLVRIIGFCLEGEEQILVYEFVPNKSLDYFLFDPVKQVELDWAKRYNIIGGIVRGLLYLHHDSSFTVIHRDLKASNILLDNEMKPKIADFGMARIFGMEQTRSDTSNIAGTYGYMAPEYAMQGQFSKKSDVYSFGVLVLEIISGKMNISISQTDGSAVNLVTHAWRVWRKGSPLEILDPSFGDNYKRDEVTKCIHIALPCVQENPADRPLLSTIILMLSSNSITLPMPRETRIFIEE